MGKPRYFLFLAVLLLALGCFLILGGDAIKQSEWPMYLGMTCLLVSVTLAAVIEGLRILQKRIEELERKLTEKR